MNATRAKRLRRTIAVSATIVAVVVVTIATFHRSSSPKTGPASEAVPGTTSRDGKPRGTTGSAAAGPGASVPAPSAEYRETELATLAHPVADPGVAAVGDRVLFAGGLDAAGASTARVGSVQGSNIQSLADLPRALHDAASATLGDALYLFGGGGDAAGELNGILRVDATGATTQVATLPAVSSDSMAAVVGNTAYIVGGYTGTRWLDTIVAFTPGSPPAVVAHIPVALRYAAVGSANGVVVIAGGSTPASRVSSAIFVFDPTTARVTKIGDLPTPLTHASAAGSGSVVLVAGGQDSARAPLATILEVDPATGGVRNAGTLTTPRSDAGLTNVGAGLVLVGGKGAAGALASVSALTSDAVAPGAPATNVYANDGANMLNPEATAALPRVYVPNSQSNTVDVIDPATYKVVDHFAVGRVPQHVTPSWDAKILYVDNDKGNSLTPIDPRTGKPGTPIAVTDPYNLYFTTDGKYAIVVAEALGRLDFRDAHSMRLLKSVHLPCRGADHMDFTADGSLALVSCEFSGEMLVVDLAKQEVRTKIPLPRRPAKPQDVKLSPDGTVFYVADMRQNGLWEIDAHTFAVLGVLPTGKGAHGLYPSRDARLLYASNRDAGTVSVIDFATRKVIDTWSIPGGSPDMGGVSADGAVLWLSGRYHAEVYAISTTDGHLIARIKVGRGPHGVAVWPQPGRYSLGHTGIMR